MAARGARRKKKKKIIIDLTNREKCNKESELIFFCQIHKQNNNIKKLYSLSRILNYCRTGSGDLSDFSAVLVFISLSPLIIIIILKNDKDKESPATSTQLYDNASIFSLINSDSRNEEFRYREIR